MAQRDGLGAPIPSRYGTGGQTAWRNKRRGRWANRLIAEVIPAELSQHFSHVLCAPLPRPLVLPRGLPPDLPELSPDEDPNPPGVTFTPCNYAGEPLRPAPGRAPTVSPARAPRAQRAPTTAWVERRAYQFVAPRHCCDRETFAEYCVTCGAVTCPTERL